MINLIKQVKFTNLILLILYLICVKFLSHIKNCQLQILCVKFESCRIYVYYYIVQLCLNLFESSQFLSSVKIMSTIIYGAVNSIIEMWMSHPLYLLGTSGQQGWIWVEGSRDPNCFFWRSCLVQVSGTLFSFLNFFFFFLPVWWNKCHLSNNILITKKVCFLKFVLHFPISFLFVYIILQY